MTSGGCGLGRLDDGMVVFVPKSAPGDLLEIEITRKKSSYSFAKILKIVENGPGRISPECDHYVNDDCWGCHFQHIDNTTASSARLKIVENALKRIGSINIEPEYHEESKKIGYRSSISPVISRSANYAGFRSFDGKIFNLKRCLLAVSPVQNLWSAINKPEILKYLGSGSRLTIKQSCDSENKDNLHLVIEVPRNTRCRIRDVKNVVKEVGSKFPLTCWVADKTGTHKVYGNGSLWESSFIQVNNAVAVTLRNHVTASIEHIIEKHGLSSLKYLDLYGGTGKLALQVGIALRNRIEEIISVESCNSASERAHENLSSAEIKHQCVSKRVETVLAELLPADIVVLNPPRNGCDKVVIDMLKMHKPQIITYISCDPATLARDLKRLGMESYSVQNAKVFDMFPQTYHAETVIVLKRNC